MVIVLYSKILLLDIYVRAKSCFISACTIELSSSQGVNLESKKVGKEVIEAQPAESNSSSQGISQVVRFKLPKVH